MAFIGINVSVRRPNPDLERWYCGVHWYTSPEYTEDQLNKIKQVSEW